MSAGFYVRIRGRVHGPVDRQKLKSLAQRGQLSRIHEISDDGQSWRPAATMPDLFTSSSGADADTQAEAGANPRARPAAGTDAPGSDPWVADAATATQSQLMPTKVDPSTGTPGSAAEDSLETWYYAKEGVQHGPVPASQIAEMIRNESLRCQDMVWKSDMDNWREAGRMPSLAPYFSPTGSGNAAVGTANGMNPPIATVDPAAASTGAWPDVVGHGLAQWTGPVRVTQIAVVTLGMLLICGGIACVLTCVFSFELTGLVVGLFSLLLGALALWVGSTVTEIKHKLLCLHKERRHELILDTLDAGNSFWQSMAWAIVVTIVATVFAALVIAIAKAIDQGAQSYSNFS